MFDPGSVLSFGKAPAGPGALRLHVMEAEAKVACLCHGYAALDAGFAALSAGFAVLSAETAEVRRILEETAADPEPRGDDESASAAALVSYLRDYYSWRSEQGLDRALLPVRFGLVGPSGVDWESDL